MVILYTCNISNATKSTKTYLHDIVALHKGHNGKRLSWPDVTVQICIFIQFLQKVCTHFVNCGSINRSKLHKYKIQKGSIMSSYGSS